MGETVRFEEDKKVAARAVDPDRAVVGDGLILQAKNTAWGIFAQDAKMSKT